MNILDAIRQAKPNTVVDLRLEEDGRTSISSFDVAELQRLVEVSGHTDEVTIYKPYTAFGQTRNMLLKTFTNGIQDHPPKLEWQHDLWIERGEDWYALLGSPYNYSTVRIIERDIWLKSKKGYPEFLVDKMPKM